MLPEGVECHPRSELDRIQRQMREVSGVSAIVYVQTCAAEKRRRLHNEIRQLYAAPMKY